MVIAFSTTTIGTIHQIVVKDVGFFYCNMLQIEKLVVLLHLLSKKRIMESVLDVRLNIPKSDIRFFRELVDKMGWVADTKESALQKYIASRPKNVKLSDNDILTEVYAVRYGK